MRMSGLDTRLIVFVRREDKPPTRHIITPFEATLLALILSSNSVRLLSEHSDSDLS